MRKRLIPVFAICCAAGGACAQERDSTPTLHLTAQLVLLDASVQDRKTGARIANLTASDFALSEEGVPQTISYLSEDRLPLSLVFLFDTTDTVQPVLKSLAAGSRDVLSHLGPRDEVSVMTFASEAKLIQDFTTDHAMLEAALTRAAKVHENRRTRIYNSLYEATQQAKRATIPDSRRVEVWLTDGTVQDSFVANQSRIAQGLPTYKTETEARDLVLHSGVVVAGLIEHSWMTDLMDPKVAVTGSMGKISQVGALTGGPFLRTSKKEVAMHFAELLDTLRQRYTVGFKPSTPQPPGTLCHLQLALSPSFYAHHITLKPNDVLIRTRVSYFR